MSEWNKAYLEALEVPIWVPLHDHKANNKPDEAVESSAIVSEESPNTKAQQVKVLQGDIQARIAFLVADDADLKTALLTFQQLQFAWKAWLDEPISAVLIQLAESADNENSELIDIERFKGQVIDCRETGHELDHPALDGPVFNFKQADKKAWWQLLQRLH